MSNSLSPVQRSWRIAAAAASWWIAFNVIAAGWSARLGTAATQAEPSIHRIGEPIAFVFCILFGFGCFVQAIQPAGEDPLRWFPPAGDRARFLKTIALELLLILTVYRVSVAWPELGPRPTVAGLGVWIIYLTLSRNPALWEVRGLNAFTLAALRGALGERLAQAAFVCLGLGLIAIATFATM